MAVGELAEMSSIFALADLHLSLGGEKPMDIFGEAWRDHARRMAEAWDSVVKPEDTVLLPGDISWAKKLEEATRDLEWIGVRPGRKLLLRGNHDSWWSSLAKVRRALPEGCEALQNNSFLVNEWVVVGARGWLSPEDPLATPNDARVFIRELDRLRLSLAHADREYGPKLPRLAMLHYPPWIEGRQPTAVVPLLERGGIRICVYGHLHGEDHRLAVRGERNGIRYQFVAADAVGFAPAEVGLTLDGGGVR
jgi:predicted phosphohydrolase